MLFFFGLIQATVILVAAFFVLHFADKSEGRLRTFGRYLGGWLVLLAGVIVIGIVTAPMFGGRPFGMQRMMGPRGAVPMERSERAPPPPDAMAAPSSN